MVKEIINSCLCNPIIDTGELYYTYIFTHQALEILSPLFHHLLIFRVIGEKEGYLLSGPFENGLFKAHKLAEVQVKLVDGENKPLQVIDCYGIDSFELDSR